MNIGISADSTCDLPLDLIQKYNIKIIPLGVNLGEEEFLDGVNITSQQLFEYTEKTGNLPKTSAINETIYKETFEELRKQYDAVIHFSLSSKISCCFANAEKAVKLVDNCYVIDTRSLSTGSGLLVLSCIDKINEGKNLNQILKELNEQVPKVQASFLVDTLKFLHKGGRCSSIALIGANMFSIKPRISLVDGAMQVTKKYIGNIENSLIRYCNDILKECPPDLCRVFVTYSSVMPVKDALIKRLKDYGFKEVYESSAGSTISSHCGRNTLGVLYIKE